jgi:hypothetical protein
VSDGQLRRDVVRFDLVSDDVEHVEPLDDELAEEWVG